MKHLNPPAACDICKAPITNEFYDCRLGPLSPASGAWANCCRKCFVRYGIGTGLGRGQHYRGSHADGFSKMK